MKIYFLLVFFLFSVVICFGDLVFSDKDHIFSIPEDYFREQLTKNRQLYSRAGLKELDFRRSSDKLVIVGNYGIFPFRIYFSVLKKSLDVYIIRIDDFLFFNMVRYSKRKLVFRIVNSLSKYQEFGAYFKLEADNSNIVIKLKTCLSNIFPQKYIVDLKK